MIELWAEIARRYHVGITSVLHRCGLIGAIWMCAGAAFAETNRSAEAWAVTFDGCLAYVESGSRDTFSRWDIAFPGGGVCNGDPTCEASSMTFIPVGRGALGAATVEVSDAIVGEAPSAATCAPACCTFYFRKDVEGVADSQLSDWQETGRIRLKSHARDGVSSYEACAYDGRRVEITVTRVTSSMSYKVALEEDAPLCAGGLS